MPLFLINVYKLVVRSILCKKLRPVSGQFALLRASAAEANRIWGVFQRYALRINLKEESPWPLHQDNILGTGQREMTT
jgi:hypothetical protein